MMRGARPGYTIIELVLVFMIGAILLAIAANGAGGYMSRKRAENARDAFVYLAMRARAAAIERGRNVSLRLNAVEGSIVVREGCATAGLELERMELADEFFATVVTAADSIIVCYSPRGFAVGAQTTVTAPTTVGFVIGKDTARARVAPLGQVEGVR